MRRSTSAARARLVAACGQPGCPVCRCVADASRRYLEALLHEQVTDVETRRRLRRAGGFCAGHGAMLQELPGAAFGAAIVHEDLLRLAIERFERLETRRAGARGWLAGLGARRSRPSAGTGTCPACADAAGAEARAVDAMLALADDAALRSAYEASDGLCVPHLALATEQGRGRADTAPLLAATLSKWRALRETLGGFLARHGRRNGDPLTADEARALRRALATLGGAPPGPGRD